MIQQSAAKPCLACGKSIKGRSDKKFCDDFCRNTYNNQLKSGDNNYVRSINNSLRRNRRILEELLPETEKMAKTTKEKLLQKGFQFKYSTHSYTNAKGNVYLFCYDYGYLPLEKDWYLLVRNSKE
jgi:hypothetical protein